MRRVRRRLALWRKQRTVGKSVSPLICRQTSGQGAAGSGGVADLRLLADNVMATDTFAQLRFLNPWAGVLSSGCPGAARVVSGADAWTTFAITSLAQREVRVTDAT
jgi:hypothetical protein